MRLLIDIGNTNTSIAVLEGNKYIKYYFIHSSKNTVSRHSLERLLGRYVASLKKIVIVSVVPRFLGIMRTALASIAPDVPVLVVGKDLIAPIRNLYDKPGEVGQDRLLVSYAAAGIYGSPALVIDFGSAVTFDYVNARGEYEGGLIFPGLRLALNSLVEGTALLPSIHLKTPVSLLGKNTRSSMNNGIILGYASLTDGVIDRFIRKYGRLKVVATGGDAVLVARYSKRISKVHPKLLLDGLRKLA